MGPFTCYVALWLVLDFPEKHYEGVRFNVISVTKGWVGFKIPGKKRYVLLKWPLYINSFKTNLYVVGYIDMLCDYREKVHIRVEKVDSVAAQAVPSTDSSPQHHKVVQISEPDHLVEVVEGELFESIVHLRAHGHACNFHIASPGVPFIVSSEGRYQMVINKIWLLIIQSSKFNETRFVSEF